MGASVQIENVTKIFTDNRSKSDLLALKVDPIGYKSW